MNSIKKTINGQFFTKNDFWLNDKKQIIDFIKENIKYKKNILDPFYGGGDLFLTLDKIIPNINQKKIGFDIDIKYINKINVFYNDSLNSISSDLIDYKNTFIITNPPYLSKVSAKRKKFEEPLKYYNSSGLNDLYKIAIQNLINFGAPGIAIIPESFINSSLFLKIHKKINIVTTIIPNPFNDTDVPVCVICFNGKKENDTLFFINNSYVYTFNDFIYLKNKIKNKHKFNIKFNSKNGQIGLKAIDSNNLTDIKFLNSSNFKYSKNKIKISSRMMTYLYVDQSIIDKINLDEVIYMANIELNILRNKSKDLIFTPFKGNINNEVRRRRLDYKTARWILENAISKYLVKNSIIY